MRSKETNGSARLVVLNAGMMAGGLLPTPWRPWLSVELTGGQGSANT